MRVSISQKKKDKGIQNTKWNLSLSIQDVADLSTFKSEIKIIYGESDNE